MKIIWLTDIHFNFVTTQKQIELCKYITSLNPDAIIITGDIGDALTINQILDFLEKNLDFQIYFVLGNHDFYYGSISQVRNEIKSLSEKSHKLNYMNHSGIIPLTKNTCIIGHDAWADGRNGDFFNSNIRLNDYAKIADLSNLNQNNLFSKLNSLGDEAARYFEINLTKALLKYQHVIVLTHVPPFKEACWHEGNTSDEEFLPHFSCKTTGEIFTNMMKDHKDKHLSVYCGHTHSAGTCFILPNLTVYTGSSIYGNPSIQSPIIIT